MEKPVPLMGLQHQFGERIISNKEIEEKYELPEGWISEKTGKEKGHAWESDENAPVNASFSCFEKLLEVHKIPKEKIRAVFGTTNPITTDGKIEDISLTEKFVKKVGFSEDVYVSEQSFGCGGPIIGIQAMKKWFESQPDETYAVYVTQDWATKMVRHRNVEALFSDAVSVSIWSNTSDGIMEIGDIFAAESTIADEDLGIIGGYWQMDGKEVSEQASKVPALVAEKLGISLNDYDIVPHQPNPNLLRTIENLYNIKMYKQVAIEHGNPTCSGSFIALEKRLEERENTIGPDTEKDILVMPFGAGGVGGFILRKRT
jgi:3-oxoacyl-[acyl-carrier-protein] synthase III